ncbi:MAG: DUF1631 domain-containing protein [Rhodoferax sp.]|jgi:hypothetical protein|nr:DUF1631 domain-containing protein [Rhodoferax sp.]
MALNPTSSQSSRLAQEIRERFVADARRMMVEITGAVQERLSVLMGEAASSREMQARRDAWTFYQRTRNAWQEGTTSGWQKNLSPTSTFAKTDLQVMDIDGLQLVGTEVVENKIISSRLVLRVMDKVSSELDDLRLRVRFLENTDELDRSDILRPEVLVLVLVEQWAAAGMPSGSWPLVNDVVQALLAERLRQAYHRANEFLIERGVMPTIDLKDRVRRASGSAPTRQGGTREQPLPPDPQDADSGHSSGYGRQGFDHSGGARGGFQPAGGARPPGGGPAPAPHAQGGQTPLRPSWAQDPSVVSGSQGLASRQGATPGMPRRSAADMAEETRMMTSATPLARARSRAQGVLGQLKRLLVGRVGPEFDATSYEPASPALAAAIAARVDHAAAPGSGGTLIEDYSPAGVARVAGQLREQTADLKNKAETKGEKATIEIVALMFQAILQEERIPPAIRVWFARLQMPVLRVALAEPDFFGTANHPARQLIDRMGSCVMGFDASGIQGGALEKEIKRVVQVIEQYPETGKRVYELVYAEFQKFLQKFLAGNGATQKVVSVAQQVEQKETLTIQYTIEMRNTLKDVPVREEIRSYLFKVWAEVLAVAAIRKGAQHAETLELKKTATDLVWAASAKPNRADRARVIQDLPKLLQRLRGGMTLLGMAPSQQDIHIKTVSDTLADAFLSKTQAIPAAQIDAMAKRLANLEDFVSEDGMGDLPLDAESIELMLGIDPATIDVVANGGSKPTNAMLAWAQELELGSWFTLDHNGRVTKVQFAWRSERKQLHLFASTDGHTYLIQAGRLAAYLQAGLLLPQEEEALTVRATRDALAKLEANPERLLG